MKCPLCYKEIPPRKLTKPYMVFQEGADTEVCGQCFLLINILEILKEIKDGIAGRSKPSFNN